MKIRAVIVGCAHMHVNEIALYISEQPDTELCGIADIAPEIPEQTDKRYTRAWNLRNIVETYHTLCYADWPEMLDTVKPDVAYVLCENFRKADVAEQIAKRGIDIILEKPMAVSPAEADRILALREKYGVAIFVNWPVAWRKHLYEMKATLDSGICGKLLKLRYLNGHTGPLGKGAKHRGVSSLAEEMTDGERGRTWWYNRRCGGGAYLDILCYGCYFSRWLFGKLPLDVMSVGANLNTPFGDAEDNVAAIMRFEDGFSIAEGTWTTPRCRMPSGPELVCSDGVIWCGGNADGKAEICAVDSYGKTLEISTVPDDPAFYNMPWQYAAYRNEKRAIYETLTAEFNADIVRMIDAAVRSNAGRSAESPARK